MPIPVSLMVRQEPDFPRQGVCNLVSTVSQALDVARGWYIAIRSDATTRMQTPVVVDDLP